MFPLLFFWRDGLLGRGDCALRSLLDDLYERSRDGKSFVWRCEERECGDVELGAFT